MPDLLLVFAKRWKLIFAITFSAAIIAFLFALLSPKKYLGVATALPANTVNADKARIFNLNIEALYSDFGSPDELDKIEGTAALDTIFIAASKELQLTSHYKITASGDALFEAAMHLKKNTRINRSSYGELKVKVWDGDRNMTATIANFLMQKLQELHQHLQNQNNILVLEKVKETYASKQKEYLQLADSLNEEAPASSNLSAQKEMMKTKMISMTEELQQYEKLIGEYQLAISANSPVLLIVENARPPLWPDKPKILATVLFSFFGAFLFSYLMALFIDSRKLSS